MFGPCRPWNLHFHKSKSAYHGDAALANIVAFFMLVLEKNFLFYHFKVPY